MCCGGQNVWIVTDGDNGMIMWCKHVPGINVNGDLGWVSCISPDIQVACVLFSVYKRLFGIWE